MVGSTPPIYSLQLSWSHRHASLRIYSAEKVNNIDGTLHIRQPIWNSSKSGKLNWMNGRKIIFHWYMNVSSLPIWYVERFTSIQMRISIAIGCCCQQVKEAQINSLVSYCQYVCGLIKRQCPWNIFVNNRLSIQFVLIFIIFRFVNQPYLRLTR